MTDIVMISGKQGSGKTTISDALRVRAKQLGYDFVGTMKFADTLYELHEHLLNKMETLTGKPRVAKDGPLLQWLGTEWGRKTFGDKVWVDILKNKINNFNNAQSLSKRLIIIDDCRFENEFDAFPESLRVRLDAPEHERRKRCPAWRDNVNHPSETGLDIYDVEKKFDLYLYTGEMHDQSNNVEHAVSTIFSKIQRGSWREKREAFDKMYDESGAV